MFILVDTEIIKIIIKPITKFQLMFSEMLI